MVRQAGPSSVPHMNCSAASPTDDRGWRFLPPWGQGTVAALKYLAGGLGKVYRRIGVCQDVKLIFAEISRISGASGRADCLYGIVAARTQDCVAWASSLPPPCAMWMRKCEREARDGTGTEWDSGVVLPLLRRAGRGGGRFCAVCGRDLATGAPNAGQPQPPTPPRWFRLEGLTRTSRVRQHSG